MQANRKTTLLLVWVPLLLAMIVLGCNSDPCKDLDCQNGGQCLNGRCFCPDGFSGDECENLEPCDTIDCLNNGTCENGVCDCPCGFSGLTCAEHITDPFVGIYTASRVCDNGSDLYSITVTKATTTCDGIILSNFYNTGSSATGEVSLTGFAIMRVQSFDIYTVTNGSISANSATGVLTISFDIADNAGNSESCTTTLTPN